MKGLIAVSQMVSTSLAVRTFDSAVYSSFDMPTVRKRLLGMQACNVAYESFWPSASVHQVSNKAPVTFTTSEF